MSVVVNVGVVNVAQSHPTIPSLNIKVMVKVKIRKCSVFVKDSVLFS